MTCWFDRRMHLRLSRAAPAVLPVVPDQHRVREVGTLMLFGSQIVSRLGVITDLSVGPPWNGLPFSMSAPPLERMLAEDAVTDVAVGRTISDVPVPGVGGGPGSSTIGHPVKELPATAPVGRRSAFVRAPVEVVRDPVRVEIVSRRSRRWRWRRRRGLGHRARRGRDQQGEHEREHGPGHGRSLSQHPEACLFVRSGWSQTGPSAARPLNRYSHPGSTKIDHAVIGATMIMLMPHCSSRL